MAIDILVQNAVGEIVLNRPDKMNALNNAMMNELSEAFDAAESAQVRALIIRGEGSAFCAGRDLADALIGFLSSPLGSTQHRTTAVTARRVGISSPA